MKRQLQKQLIPKECTGYKKRDLIVGHGLTEYPYMNGKMIDASSNSSNNPYWQSHQLLITDAAVEINVGIDYIINIWMMGKGESGYDIPVISTENCTKENGWVKVVHAYPSIHGIPKPHPSFMAEFVRRNGKGVVWVEILMKSFKSDVGDTYPFRNELVYRTHPTGELAMVIEDEESKIGCNLDLDKLAKSVRDTLANETTESIDKWFEDNQSTTATVSLDDWAKECYDEFVSSNVLPCSHLDMFKWAINRGYKAKEQQTEREMQLLKTEVEKLEAIISICRHYLMSAEPDKIIVEDLLEILGFNRNGL